MILKKYAPEETPNIGDIKTKRHFAFIPKRIGAKLIWLEFWHESFIFRVTTQEEWELSERRIQDIMPSFTNAKGEYISYPLAPYPFPSPNAWHKLDEIINKIDIKTNDTHYPLSKKQQLMFEFCEECRNPNFDNEKLSKIQYQINLLK